MGKEYQSVISRVDCTETVPSFRHNREVKCRQPAAASSVVVCGAYSTRIRPFDPFQEVRDPRTYVLNPTGKEYKFKI